MASDFETRIERVLDANGVTAWSFVKRRGKHPSVVVKHGGREWRFFYPSSSSDRRGAANFAALLRRKLGLRNLKRISA
jgi:hypothetical protein